MKASLRFVAMALVVLMSLSIVACATPEENPPATTPAATSTPKTNPSSSAEQTTAPATTAYHKNNGLPTANFNDSDFRILGCEDYNVTRGAQRDIVYFDQIQTNSINEGVYARNQYVEDTYGVKIKAVWKMFSEIDTTILQANKSGLVVCEGASVPYQEYSVLIDDGACVDLNTVPTLDLTQTYWDQKCRQSMSIANRLYYITGDLMLADKSNTWMIVFNRDIQKNEQLADPYDLVFNYQWTYDQMYNMAKAVTKIGDTPVSVSNYYGILSEPSNTYFLWLGNGASLVSKDKVTDKPIVPELSEGSFDAMQKAATMQYDNSATIFTNAFTTDIPYAQVFLDGHVLFKIGSVGYVETLRDYDMDFGVLPLPNLNEENRQYYAVMSPANSYAYMLPASLKKSNNKYGEYNHLDYAGFVSQALCCESGDTMMEGYYEKTMVYKGLRMERDEAMLQLIFDNRLFDLTYVYGWADSLKGEITSAKSEMNLQNLKSKYDKYAKSITNAIDKFLEKQGIN